MGTTRGTKTRMRYSGDNPRSSPENYAKGANQAGSMRNNGMLKTHRKREGIRGVSNGRRRKKRGWNEHKDSIGRSSISPTLEDRRRGGNVD